MSPIPMPGACDCHMHVYDSRFLQDPAATLTAPDAPAQAYRRLQHELGLSRCVVVTPSAYGLDNTSTLVAMRELERAGAQVRGIAVVNASIDDGSLAALHDAGVRGVRFNQTRGGTSLDDLEPLAERIAALGWHIELLLPAELWQGIAPRLRALAVPVVFDHFGRLPYPGSQHHGHRAILDLLATDRAWVKLSGAYLQGVPPVDWDADAAAMTRALVDVAPHRLVWGTNWPHPSATAGQHQAPQDRDQIPQLRRWLADDALLQRVLADNAAVLYDF